jgi:hypothetical protein
VIVRVRGECVPGVRGAVFVVCVVCAVIRVCAGLVRGCAPSFRPLIVSPRKWREWSAVRVGWRGVGVRRSRLTLHTPLTAEEH